MLSNRFLDSSITTVYDRAEQPLHGTMQSGLIKGYVRKLLPRGITIEDLGDGEIRSQIEESLPLVKSFYWGNNPLYFSVLVLYKKKFNAAKFLYEWISRGLLPGKSVEIVSFTSSDFSIRSFGEEVLSVAEVVVPMQEESDLEYAEGQFRLLAEEMRLGLGSLFQAKKMLEMRGGTSHEKNSVIQETIASLVHSRLSKEFDYGIFGELQHFLANATEPFKQMRLSRHLSKILCIFYLYRKSLSEQVEVFPLQRHLLFKSAPVFLQTPFGSKKVLALFVGLSFVNDNEVFEERHLLRAVREYFPHVQAVPGSFFLAASREDRVQILYLEVQKEDLYPFTLEEQKLLKQKLPEDLKGQVEQLMPSLFMPRNEEEVMKNIVMLGQQLKYIKDIPQVFISFEEIEGEELTFTVIVLRILLQTESLSLFDLYKRTEARFAFVEDRIKKMGLLRGKYPKEATVFRLKLPKADFMRADHSVDLLKARLEVALEVHKILGEFRDYNGGMIAKQYEAFSLFKNGMKDANERVLEDFFQAISPVEMRGVVNPKLLQHLCKQLEKMKEFTVSSQEDVFYILDEVEESLYFMSKSCSLSARESLSSLIKQLRLSSSEAITVDLEWQGQYYQGILFFSLNEEKKRCLCNFLFENPKFSAIDLVKIN